MISLFYSLYQFQKYIFELQNRISLLEIQKKVMNGLEHVVNLILKRNLYDLMI